jgi:hypothetical protein
MRPIFYDQQFNVLLQKYGYVVLPLLDENEVNFLLSEHKKIEPKREEAFYTSIWHSDENYRKKVNQLISSIIPNKLSSIIINYKPVFANFMVKKAQEKSTLNFHQDWTFVDESNYVALNVWIPLIDTNKENGALQVIKGSHHFDIPYRGRNIEGPYWHLSKYIKTFFAQLLEVKKGHAVIFDERLIHGSFDNTSQEDRLAVSNVMIPQEATLFHYFKTENGNTIQKFKVESEFFTRYALSDDITSYSTPEKFQYTIKPYTLLQFSKDYLFSKSKKI